MNDGVVMISLDYDPNTNTIQHEDGRILDDISHLISDKDLLRLKIVGGTMYIQSDEDGVIYELTAPVPGDDEGIVRLYYDKEKNVMFDECGFINFNVFSYITPQMLSLFKEKKEDMCVYGKDGQIVELIYDWDETEC